MEYYRYLSSASSARPIRLSIPLIFTALAGLFSERAGVFDIGLEGKMLASAFAAACVAVRHRLGLARPRLPVSSLGGVRRCFTASPRSPIAATRSSPASPSTSSSPA